MTISKFQRPHHYLSFLPFHHAKVPSSYLPHRLPLDIRVGPSPSDLKPSTAFRIFPIAYQYDLHVVLEWCTEAVGAAQPISLWPSSEAVTSASVPHQPGLVQWLALADQKHCDELLGSCVTQLTSSNGNVMRQALASRHLGPLVDGLSSETKSDIIWKMAGLPPSIKVGIWHLGFSKCIAGLSDLYSSSL